ncbi:MAG: hypothetical protein K2P70_17475 [Hyphomonadaceae bacterium]|nr:hypothetical protein [Hyphomonadaceae bacterium]
MKLSIQITVSPEVAVEALQIRNVLQERVDKTLPDVPYSSGIDEVMVFPTFLDPERGSIPDRVKFFANENSVRSTRNGSFANFRDASLSQQYALVVDMIQQCLDQIGPKYLVEGDRQALSHALHFAPSNGPQSVAE